LDDKLVKIYEIPFYEFYLSEENIFMKKTLIFMFSTSILFVCSIAYSQETPSVQEYSLLVGKWYVTNNVKYKNSKKTLLVAGSSFIFSNSAILGKTTISVTYENDNGDILIKQEDGTVWKFYVLDENKGLLEFHESVERAEVVRDIERS